MTDKVTRESTATTAPAEANLQAFKELFPGVILDGALDAARLGEALGIEVTGLKDGKERFGLMWAGKKKAVEALQTPSMAALVPDLENSITWDTAENVFIEGDNLEVLKLLQNAYNDKVKLIYIDPPYNTGNDFVYNDDFSDPLKHYLEVTGQVDAEGNRLVANTEVSGRKHSNWLTMMHPRLVLARNLLTQDGAIFVSIDDNELHNLRSLMDEIFGPENFVACVTWHKTYSTRNDAQEFSKSHEYLLVYKRLIWNRTLLPRPAKSNEMYKYNDGDGRGPYRTDNLTAARNGGAESLPLVNPNTGISHYPSQGLGWRHSPEKLQELLLENRIYWGRDGQGAPQLKRYLSDVQDGVVPTTIWHYDEVGHTDKAAKEVKELLGAGIFDYPKPLDLLARIIALGMGKDDIILDFFAGSGTTAHATMLANEADGGTRKFILVTLDEPVAEGSIAASNGFSKVSQITLERIKKARKLVTATAAGGLKALRLAGSAFNHISLSESSELAFFVETLKSDAAEEHIAQEILLHLGVPFDTPWRQVSVGASPAIQAGSTLIVLAATIDDATAQASLNSDAQTLVFMEDAFAGKDSIKSNMYFAAKAANKIMKTF